MYLQYFCFFFNKLIIFYYLSILFINYYNANTEQMCWVGPCPNRTFGPFYVIALGLSPFIPQASYRQFSSI